MLALTPPLSLYIHLPWCLKKCPYCDFNSHETRGPPPDGAYAAAVVRDLEFAAEGLGRREIVSIFFGGGTPSLMSPAALATILDAAAARLTLSAALEITLEANPGAADSGRFAAYRQLGINRLSIGAQSFDDAKLAALGRIHDGAEAAAAIAAARAAGFDNINVDLMRGLPGQAIEEALGDLEQALAFAPEHVSWYQLTIEPNTAFHARPPALPDEESVWRMTLQGEERLARRGYQRYEVSSWSRPGRACLHNLNYWRFGDYLGLGAGAHGKLSCASQGRILRQARTRLPASYMDKAGSAAVLARQTSLRDAERPLEFMLNALRLKDGVPAACFSDRTGLPLSTIHPQLKAARAAGLLDAGPDTLRATERGARYLNDLLQHFMPA